MELSEYLNTNCWYEPDALQLMFDVQLQPTIDARRSVLVVMQDGLYWNKQGRGDYGCFISTDWEMAES